MVNRDWNTEERHDRRARSECKSCGMKISLKKYSQRPGSASRQWLGNQKLLVRFRVIVESLPVNEQIPGDTETKNFGEPRYQARVTMSERMIKFSLLWWHEKRHLVTSVLQSVDRQCCRRDDGVKKDISKKRDDGVKKDISKDYGVLVSWYHRSHLNSSTPYNTLSVQTEHSHTECTPQVFLSLTVSWSIQSE